MQALLHLDQFLDLALEHLLHRDPGPARDDPGDVLLVDLFFQQAVLLLERDQLAIPRLQLLLDLRHLAVLEAGGGFEIRHALGALSVDAQLLLARFQLADLLDQRLLLLPL